MESWYEFELIPWDFITQTDRGISLPNVWDIDFVKYTFFLPISGSKPLDSSFTSSSEELKEVSKLILFQGLIVCSAFGESYKDAYRNYFYILLSKACLSNQSFLAW